MAKKKYSYMCDMASIAIEFGGVVQFFGNRLGDGYYSNGICVEENMNDAPSGYEFVGHFEVRSEHATANLLDYDCEATDVKVLHRFGKGRYPVYLDVRGRFYIGQWD